MNILADASLPGLIAAFPEPFKLCLYQSEQEIPALLAGQDVLLCRSTLIVNHALLHDYPLKFVATASSGTDHLDHDYLQRNNTRILDAKGCNAHSVADYVLACLAYLDNKALKSVGIIGMGAVGTQVYGRLEQLGLQIKCFDPLKASHDPQFKSCSLDELKACDLLCIHAELHNTTPYPSYNLIDQEFLAGLKPNAAIINAARGGIVNEEAILSGSEAITYCTDVYLNEPKIDKRIIARATLCTPHIAGHSLEAKYAAVALISKQLHQILGLPIPVFAKPEPALQKRNIQHNTWQEKVLSLYNPIEETQKLKNASDLTTAFLSVRKDHKFRYDFDVINLAKIFARLEH